MTFSHGFDGNHNAINIADASVHNIEMNMRGGFDYGAVYGEINNLRHGDTIHGRFDSGQFRLQVNEMDRRFHQDGYLPHLHIRLDQGCNPLMVPDSGFGIARSHSPFGPFHTGHYVHHHHHRLPAPQEIGNANANNATAYGPDSAATEVVADAGNGPGSVSDFTTGSAVGNDAPVIAGGPTGPDASSNQSSQGSLYRPASNALDGASGNSLPDMNITDGGLPGGIPDSGGVPVDQTPAMPGPGAQAGDQSVQPVARPAVRPAMRPAMQPDVQPQIQPEIQPQMQPATGADRPADAPSVVPVAKVPDAQLTLSGAPTITPAKIDEVLRAYHSPAAGMGQYVYDQGLKHGINPAMALAFYCVESQCGTKGLAVHNKSWGNVRGHGPHGYRPYDSIKESLDHWYDMIKTLYQDKFHADKLGKVIAHYAPNSDGNNEAAYVRSVGSLVRKWQC